MNKTYFFQADIKSFEEENGEVIIEGYASTPDVDRYKDIVDPKAFKDALDLFMKNPVMLRSHDPDRPVGTWLSATVSGRGLKVRGKVVDPQTKQEIIDGRMRALSIGYIPLESELQHADGTPFNFEKDDIFSSDLVRKITKLDLIEISIVSTPANGYALFTLAKSAKLYFNELVTKSFMKTKNNGEEPGKDVQPEEGATEETKAPEETTEGEKPKEESEEEKAMSQEEDEEDDNSEDEEEEKATEVSKKEAGTPEGDEAPQPTEQGSENAGETPAADTEEAPKGDDESATDDESEEGEEGSDDESEAAISIDEETAKTLDEFVQAGVMAVAKDAKNVLVIPKQIQNLLLAMKTVIGDQKEAIENLNQKLNKTPEKRALKVTGQFNETKAEDEEEQEGEGKKAPSAFSKAFKSLIQNAK